MVHGRHPNHRLHPNPRSRPSHRKRGIATELLRLLETSASTAGATTIALHVAESNTAAIHLYQAHGYQPQGREENYYTQGIPALTYLKPLDLTTIPSF